MDYFELRSADAQAKLLADTVKDYQEALRITTNRFEGGITNEESDVFQAKTQLQQAIVAQQSDVAVQRAQYEHAIAILIGQPPNSFSLPVAALASDSLRRFRRACRRSCWSGGRILPRRSGARQRRTSRSALRGPRTSLPWVSRLAGGFEADTLLRTSFRRRTLCMRSGRR